MAAIWTPGMARAARAWVCVMLPEPIRPMWVVMGGGRMIRNFADGLDARKRKDLTQRARRERALRRNTLLEMLTLLKRRQDRRTPKWVRVRAITRRDWPSLRDSFFYWRVPRTSSWAKFFDVPPGLVNAHEIGLEGRSEHKERRVPRTSS